MIKKCVKENNLMIITFLIFLGIGIYLLFNIKLYEGFQSEDLRNELLNKIKIGLSEKLGISIRRLINVVYTGSVEEKNLRVSFQVDKRNNMEKLEKSNTDVQKSIENMVNDGLFIIKIGDEYVNIASRADFNMSRNNNNNNNINDSNSEQFQDSRTYIKNYDPRFDNIDVFNAARFVMSKYRQVPFDPELSEFITLDTQDGELVAIPESRELI